MITQMKQIAKEILSLSSDTMHVQGKYDRKIQLAFAKII